MKSVTLSDIEDQFANKIKTENYTSKKSIENVRLLSLNHISTEDGYFLELARVGKNNSLKAIPEFKIKQISYSLLDPNAIKAWHIHYKQEDILFVPPHNKLLVGLHDLRKKSSTTNNIMRLILGAQHSTILLIPRGVAHGWANITKNPVALIYMANSQFNINKHDEHRLPWDYLGKNFWKIKKD